MTESTETGLKLFIHFPIVEFKKTFELYEIFVLPVYDAKSGVGLRHSSLPQYLAVAGDQQTFI